MNWNILLLIFIMGQAKPDTDPRTGIMFNAETCAREEQKSQRYTPAQGGYVEAVCLNLDNMQVTDNYPAK